MGASAATRAPQPAVPKYHVSLEKLGYRPVTSPILQREGYSMNSLDFIDNEHVLVTFNAHKLVPRSSEDRETDSVRLIRAVVLHLPDGKLVHEAEWRTHDHNRYLWPLRDGRFLLRVRNNLYLVRALHGHEGVERHLVLEAKGEIEIVEVSQSGDLVLVETTPERHIGDDPTVPLEHTVRAAFYSVLEGEHPSFKLRAHVEAERPFYTAFTSLGFLSTTREDRMHWGFDFHPFAGKTMELAGFTSTCQPRAEFLGESTFIATGCRGGDDRRLLAGFDLNAEANWVFTTDDAPVWPSLSSAPASGRFALRDTVLQAGSDAAERVSAEEVRGQEIRVYNFRGGVEMLRANSGPVQRAPQNFALSPDGLTLAVLHGSDLEVYALPAVTEADRKALQHQAEPLKGIAAGEHEEIKLQPEMRPRP